jgi:benzoyl-CoA reductase/2-hydroxyglutaryl-CoA dehydratase subunit BcrC/BadD/HgdB
MKINISHRDTILDTWKEINEFLVHISHEIFDSEDGNSENEDFSLSLGKTLERFYGDLEKLYFDKVLYKKLQKVCALPSHHKQHSSKQRSKHINQSPYPTTVFDINKIVYTFVVYSLIETAQSFLPNSKSQTFLGQNKI